MHKVSSPSLNYYLGKGRSDSDMHENGEEAARKRSSEAEPRGNGDELVKTRGEGE